MRKYSFLFLAVLLILSCYKEENLTASEEVQIEPFEFPQGDNSWDKEIVEIYEKYGVKLVYKDFNSVKFNGSWKAADNKNEFFGEDLNEEQVKFNVNFFKNEVFKYLSPELTKECFPKYIYMCYDAYRLENKKNAFPARLVVSNPGYWISCLEGTLKLDGTTRDSIDRPETPIQLREARGRILQRIFCMSILKGNIKPPTELSKEGGIIDYITPVRFSKGTTIKKEVNLTDPKVTNEVIDDPNLATTRGFPHAILSTYFIEIPAYQEGDVFRFRDYKLYQTIGIVSPEKLLWDYVNMAMRFSDEELRRGYIRTEKEVNWGIFPILIERHPLLFRVRGIVIDYMKKEYNIDLTAIYNGTDPQ